jgi:probable blue pigment (indigoidine) exporter
MMRALPIGLLFLAFSRELPKGHWWWRVSVLGMLNFGLFFGLLFFATYRLPGGVAATLGAVQPLLVGFLAWKLLGETLLPARVAAGIMGIIGVAMLVLGTNVGLDPLGVLAVFVLTSFGAMGLVLTKKWGRPTDVLTFTGWQLVIGGLFLIPMSLIIEGGFPPLTSRNIVGFIYLGLVNTGFSYAFWFRGIVKLPASAVTFLALFTPMVATIIGWLVLGQKLTGIQIGGMLVIFTSVVIAQLVGRPGVQTISPSQNGQTLVQTGHSASALPDTTAP